LKSTSPLRKGVTRAGIEPWNIAKTVDGPRLRAGRAGDQGRGRVSPLHEFRRTLSFGTALANL
jgi:hypothetical protein